MIWRSQEGANFYTLRFKNRDPELIIPQWLNMIHLPCLSKIVMLVDIFSPLALKLTLLISGSHITVNISSTYMTPFWSLETKAGHTSKSLNGLMIITFSPQEERSSYHPACSVLLRKRRLVTNVSTELFKPKSMKRTSTFRTQRLLISNKTIYSSRVYCSSTTIVASLVTPGLWVISLSSRHFG